MDFAKRQLEKYGWKEGCGLGKHENGISKALKPKLKFDNSGLGHSLSDELLDPWWQRVYDEAANNITTKSDGHSSVIIGTKSDSVGISIKKRKHRKGKSQSEGLYNGFIKTATLTKNGERKLPDSAQPVSELEENERKQRMGSSGICDLTDEELFVACGGRTIHKGARHGVKMNAKLARIEEHESKLMHDLAMNSSNGNRKNHTSTLKKVKKKNQKKQI